MKNKQQLEIGLAINPRCARRRQAQRVRPARAQWWFERMRRVVDAVAEPEVSATTAPIQTPLPSLPSVPERKAA